MINYSIVMRSVNSNLIEINKAKGRVNEAKKNNTEPDPADVALVNSEVQKAYAMAQYSDVVTIEKLSRHIASHGCVYSRADINAILNLTVDCVRELLLDGKKVQLGDLGDFSVTLTSKGAENPEKFTAQYITGVSVAWDCGNEFKNLLADAEFNLVASRSAQAAVLKAIKAGKTSVDLTETGTSGQQTTSPSAGQQTTDNGQQTPSGGTTGSNTNPTAKAKYTLTVQSADEQQGSVTGGGQYEEGSEATLKATAKSGYQFKQWNDGNTSMTRKVTVTEDKTYTATFEEEENDDSAVL